MTPPAGWRPLRAAAMVLAGPRADGNPACLLSGTDINEGWLRPGIERISHWRVTPVRCLRGGRSPPTNGKRVSSKSFPTLAEQKIGVYLARVTEIASHLSVFLHRLRRRLLVTLYCFKISPFVFTALENYPFAVLTEPRPLPPKTGRAPMMRFAMRRSN